jgi:hypothetical protein
MSVAVSPSSPPNGQNQDPVLVLVVAVLAATMSPEPSELQAARTHAQAASKRIRIDRSYELFQTRGAKRQPPWS